MRAGMYGIMIGLILFLTSCNDNTGKNDYNDLLSVEVLNGGDSHCVSGWCDADTLFIAIPSYACDDSLKVKAEKLTVCDLADGTAAVRFVRPGGIYQIKGKQK